MSKLFDPSRSDYLENASDGIVRITGITVSAWVYLETLPAAGVSYYIFHNFIAAPSVDAFTLYFTQGSSTILRLNARTTPGTGLPRTATISTTYASGWWHCAAMWVASNDRRVYLNNNKGTSIAAASADTGSSSTTRISDSSNTFDGAICEVGIWNSFFNENIITQLSRGYSPLFFRQNLVCYLPLRGLNVIDYVGGYIFNEHNSPQLYSQYPRIKYPNWCKNWFNTRMGHFSDQWELLVKPRLKEKIKSLAY